MTSEPAPKSEDRGLVKSPMHATPVPKTPAFTDADAKQVAHIINLQIAGWTIDEIAKSIKLDRGAVEDLLLRHQRRFVKNQKELVTHMRGLANDRLDRLLKSVWDDATDSESPKQFPAQDRALRNIEQQRKLWGLDAPAQVEISHRPSDEAVSDLVTKVSAVIHGVPLEDDDVLELDPEDYHEVEVTDEQSTEGPAAEFDADSALDAVSAARTARASAEQAAVGSVEEPEVEEPLDA